MKISELSAKLRSQSEEWGRQRRALEQDGLWTQMSTHLSAALKTLIEPTQFLHWASEYDGMPSGIAGLSQLKDARRRLAQLQTGADSNPAKLLNSPAISDTLSSITELSEELDRLASDRWKFILRTAAWDKADLWAAYRGNVDHGANVQRATSLDQQFDNLTSQKYLGKAAERERFVKLLEEHQALIAKLPPVPDDSIRAFIKEAQEGVRLSLIDDEVLSWLRTQNLLGAFIVKYQR
jgi:hypothetical protein